MKVENSFNYGFGGARALSLFQFCFLTKSVWQRCTNVDCYSVSVTSVRLLTTDSATTAPVLTHRGVTRSLYTYICVAVCVEGWGLTWSFQFLGLTPFR